jgi:hypothetical protein
MKISDLKLITRQRPVWPLLALTFLGAAGSDTTLAAGPSRLPLQFSGLLNDYTPPAPAVAGGTYEMHGKWSLQLSDREGGRAIFSAEMSMETADFANPDVNHDPTKLSPHTHHISVADGVLHDDPTDPINWKSVCPTFKPPVTTGFVVTGTAYITGNGGNPPFGNPSAVTLCILGGTPSATVVGTQTFVEFSNFTLTFGSKSLASTHFGTQAINGVVVRCEGPWARESSACRVAVVD